jgi:hypothetical protein
VPKSSLFDEKATRPTQNSKTTRRTDMKKRWIITGLATGILAVALTTGAMFAQSADGTSADSPVRSFAARLAAKLGLDEATVDSAIKDTRREMRDEAVKARLDKMVEKGVLTQEQADEYLQWYADRPEDMPGVLGKHHRGPGHHRGFAFGRFPGGPPMGEHDDREDSEAAPAAVTSA